MDEFDHGRLDRHLLRLDFLKPVLGCGPTTRHSGSAHLSLDTDRVWHLHRRLRSHAPDEAGHRLVAGVSAIGRSEGHLCCCVGSHSYPICPSLFTIFFTTKGIRTRVWGFGWRGRWWRSRVGGFPFAPAPPRNAISPDHIQYLDTVGTCTHCNRGGYGKPCTSRGDVGWIPSSHGTQ
jgi:hypothetical protein